MNQKAIPERSNKVRTDEPTGTRVKPALTVDYGSHAVCERARKLFTAGQGKEALELLLQELDAGRESPEVQYWAGRIAFRIGDLPQAQRALSRAIALSPRDVQAQLWLSRVLLRRGNSTAAMRVLRIAIRGGSEGSELIAQSCATDEGEVMGPDADEPPTTKWTVRAVK